MPGPTETDFFDARRHDGHQGRRKRARTSPTQVAQRGLRGADERARSSVVAGVARRPRPRARRPSVLPDSRRRRAMHRQMAEPARADRGITMRALTWHGKRDVRVDTVPDPTIQDPTDVIVRDHLHRHLRLGPAPVRGARALPRRGRHPRARADGRRRRGRARRHRAEGGRPRGGAVQRLLRHLLHVRSGPALPVRDDAGARARHGRRALRLHQALRAGARRAGRVPAGAVRQHAADQGAGRAAGRPVRLPVRRAAHRLAGGGVRGRPTRRHPGRAGPRADRRHGHARRAAPRRRDGDRRRPGARAAGAGAHERRHRPSTCAGTARTSATSSAA